MSSYGPAGQPPNQLYPTQSPHQQGQSESAPGQPWGAPGQAGPGGSGQPWGGSGQGGSGQPWGGSGQGGPGQPWGGPPPRKRGWVGVLVGLGVVLVLVAGGAAAWLTQRGDSGGSAPAYAPSTVPNVVKVGGTTTGQALELSAALTAKGLECTVRYTGNAGGQAGCFRWGDKGTTSSQVLFQYQPDGTVIGLNLKTVGQREGASFVELALAFQAVAPVVFAADQDKVAQAVANVGKVDDTSFEGSWGKYHVRDGASGTTVSAAKSGAAQLAVPDIQMANPPAKLADAFSAQGFTCSATREDCDSTFREGKGRLSVLSSTVGTKGTLQLIIGADDTSRDANSEQTKKAFSDLVHLTLGLAGGNGLPAVDRWFDDQLDGDSHSAYVGGWRVDLVVKYGTPYGAASLASNYRLTISADTLWTVPN